MRAVVVAFVCLSLMGFALAAAPAASAQSQAGVTCNPCPSDSCALTVDAGVAKVCFFMVPHV